MKAISIRQPWAELIARGEKTIELRTWTTKYRGPVLVCAGARRDRSARAAPYQEGELATVPLGVAVCVVELYHIRPTLDANGKLACVDLSTFGEYTRARLHSWFFTKVRRVSAVHVVGRLGLFNVELQEDGHPVPLPALALTHGDDNG